MVHFLKIRNGKSSDVSFILNSIISKSLRIVQVIHRQESYNPWVSSTLFGLGHWEIRVKSLAGRAR